MKEGLVNLNMALVPDNQASKIADPGKGALDFPPFFVAPELSAVLRLRFTSVFTMRRNQINFKPLQPLAQRITVIATVGNQSLRPLFGPPSSTARHFDRFQGRLSQRYFRRRCRGKGASQRNTFAVDHHHPLCAFALFGFPDAGAPFFAGAKLPSMKASSQSSAPFSSSMERNLRQTSSQTPCSSQSRNRRQHVEALGYRSGKSCHRAPVRKIHKMPSKTSRLSADGRPPLGFLRGSGSSGFSSFHWSSFMKRVYSAIGAPPIA